MAALILEGETLGQKHRHFNSLVRATISDQTWNLENINQEEPDIQNLLRIDVASGRRNVPYILEVIKSKDKLYVDRAIKRSTWLITEHQYAHIINPTYLEESLFPSMTAKAKTKLLLAIRKNLKDETRVEAFFKYYEDNLEIAMKWLPGCSINTIEMFVSKYPHHLIKRKLVKRLCSKSFTILKTYCNSSRAVYKGTIINLSTYYLKSNCDEFLDIVESYRPRRFHRLREFNKHSTQIIMNNCRERVINYFEKYCFRLHIPTFARNLKSAEVQDFLIKQKQKGCNYWLNYENIRHFLKYIPKTTRLQFIKKIFEKDESQNSEGDDGISNQCFRSGMCKKRTISKEVVSNKEIYQWYRYIPFNTAMAEIKKLIRVEPLPAERNAMLTVLIKCAGSNQEKMQNLLQYYHDNHINEPFVFKIQFVNTFLSHTRTHELNDKSWNVLNNIFLSMDVYTDSDNKVPFCIDAIIVYKIMHNDHIPQIIEEKFIFNTFSKYRKRLELSQENKIFDYLYNHQMKILLNQEITNTSETTQITSTIKNLLNLLAEYKRDLVDYPIIMNKIKELIKMKQNFRDSDLTELYNALKNWRKHLFEESLIMHPSDEACLNALKHDPGMLVRYQNEIMYSNDAMSIERTLRKVRIYWPESIAQQWNNYYLERIHQPKGQKAVKYVFILTARHKILPLIEENAPTETKINWNNTSELKVILRKNIAKYMHLVRPSVNLDTVLLYTKGDYLHHALPSLNAILYNMSSDSTLEYMMKLLNVPVSLQKHGICVIFKKIKYKNIKEIVKELWEKTKNSTIKTLLYQQAFLLMCKEKNYFKLKELWQLIEMFIDSLTSEENANIYDLFNKLNDVPITVRPLFFMKGYLYLKSLSPKANCNNIIQMFLTEAPSLIDMLEPSFVEDTLLVSLENKFLLKQKCLIDHFKILTSYIISCKSEKEQTMRYNKMLLPILQKSFASWKLLHEGKYYIKIRTKELLDAIIKNTTKLTASKQNIIPVKLYKAIQVEITNCLPAEENYEILLNWNLATLFVEIVDNYLKVNPQSYIQTQKPDETIDHYDGDDNNIWETICFDVCATFSEACKSYLKEDTLYNQYPVLHTCVKNVLKKLWSNLNFENKSKFGFLKAMLTDKEPTTIYCIAIEAIRNIYCSSEDESKKEILDILYSNTSPEVKILIGFHENNDYDWYYDLKNDEEQNK